MAQPNVHCEVYYSRVITAPLLTCWNTLTPFGKVASIVDKQLEGSEIINGKGQTEIGAVREVRFPVSWGLALGPRMAQAHCEAYYSRVITAPLQTSWDALKPFGKLATVADKQLEDSEIINDKGQTEVGAVRELRFPAGAKLYEELKAFDELNKTFTYHILPFGEAGRAGPDASPFPTTLFDYYATVTMEAITEDNTTFAKWTARWEVDAEHADTMKGIINGVFAGALGRLQEKVGK
ncbi:hypothetical protein WJX72_010553 [[Myrmecia] bisecta]|uniref:Uncharacterized protein n=1 Tax=[Myrmecia] bisecta TaxID=41462 RepID=A0AAW1PGX3_9CHLO